MAHRPRLAPALLIAVHLTTPHGPRTNVAILKEGVWIGTTQSRVLRSADGGRSWTAVAAPGFHAIGFAPRTRIGWAVGEKGAISRVEM